MPETSLDVLLRLISAHELFEAMVWHDQSFKYGWLKDEIERWDLWLIEEGFKAGSVVFLESDYCPVGVALLLALWKHRAIVVPFSQGHSLHREEFLRISEAEVVISIDDKLRPELKTLAQQASHVLYSHLRQLRHPGLVLFSSGTAGPSKGIVHDVQRLLAKVARIQLRHPRTLAFLIFDHLGGIDTLLYTLASAGCLVVPSVRTPDGCLEAIERYKVDLLPTSPSFLNLVLLSNAWQRHDLSSLRKISYGSEPMPETVLKRFHQLFPSIKMTQTYALSELGVLRSASVSSDSLWMTLGGEGYETRVVDGILQVRSPYMMLGYLNAPSNMTPDGWFITGDLVEVSGSLVRVKGRVSDIINVGGEKVFPTEVEDVIRELDEVADVTVYGASNAILGHIVCARIVPTNTPAKNDLISLVRGHCLRRLPKYKVPIRVEIVTNEGPSERFKKRRIVT